MTDKLLSLIGQRFPLKERDAGAYKSLKVNGMKFTITPYEAEGLGHVSVMKASGMFGLMKMDTLKWFTKVLHCVFTMMVAVSIQSLTWTAHTYVK